MRSLIAQTPVATLYSAMSALLPPLSAWTTLIATTSQPACGIEIASTAGSSIMIAIGSAGQEVAIPYTIPSGGSPILLPVSIPKGVRVSIQPLGVAPLDGELILNFFG